MIPQNSSSRPLDGYSSEFATSPISPRLEELVVQISRGEAPNSGRFCGNCYTPMAPDRQACAYCGVAVAERPTVGRLPAEVFEIVRAKRKRESVIVNSFAFLGLGLGTIVAILFAVFIVLPGWATAVLFVVVLLIAGRGLAALLGGWIGDNVGYRSANRLVHERWAAFVQRRDDLTENDALTR